MSLPLLGNDFLSSPNARGAITGKTADILAQAGQRQADRIDLMSTTAEAKMMAPGITDLYSKAYQKIAAGDFTGFADMQKARSMAIGNPILMKTMDEADQFAGTLAGQYTRQQMMKMQMDKTQMIEQNRDSRLDTRMQEDAAKRNEMAARQTYATDSASWEKENMEIQNSYNRELTAAKNRQNGENSMAQLEGRQPNQIPMPDKPQVRPRPALDDYLQKFGVQVNSPSGSEETLPSQDADHPALNVGDNIFNETQPQPTGGRMTTQQAKAAAGAAPINAPLPVGPGEASPNIDLMRPDGPANNPQPQVQPANSPQPNAQPATLPLVNQSSPQIPPAGTQVPHGTPVIRFGTLDISVPSNKPRMDGMTIDEKTGDVKPHYTMTNDDKKFLDAIGKVPNTVANFASEAHRSGEDIEFRPATPEQAAQVADKKGPFYVVRSSGGVVLTERDLDPTGNVRRDANGKALPDKPVIFDANTEKAWTEAHSLMQTSGLKINMPQIDDPQQKESMRNFVIADMASNPDKVQKLDLANKTLKSWGVDPVTTDDIQQRLASAQDQAKTAKDKKVQDAQDERARSGLRNLGILPPEVSKDKPQGPRANWTSEEYHDRIDSNQERLNTLAQMAKDGALTTQQQDEALNLQKEINIYKDELPRVAFKEGVRAMTGGMFGSPIFGF